MALFSDMFKCDSKVTLNFFFQHLKDLTENLQVCSNETVYVASVLAHYAQTPRSSMSDMPPFVSLSEIFDNFILKESMIFTDPEIMEVAGSESLLLAGYFRDQMKRRHNLHWYDFWGKRFYENASSHCTNQKRSKVLERMSVNFGMWAVICRNMNRYFRDQPYLIRMDN